MRDGTGPSTDAYQGVSRARCTAGSGTEITVPKRRDDWRCRTRRLRTGCFDRRGKLADAQTFVATRPNETWVTDIHVRADSGRLVVSRRHQGSVHLRGGRSCDGCLDGDGLSGGGAQERARHQAPRTGDPASLRSWLSILCLRLSGAVVPVWPGPVHESER